MRALAAFSIGCVLLLGACGPETSGGEPASPEGAPSPGGFPVSVRAANGRVEIAVRPRRIVSLSPTATEMLFAIGAGPQVTAVDDNSDYPARAPTTRLSGYEPNVEAIAARDPDLVVLSNATQGLLGALKNLDIAALLQPAATTLADTYEQIEQLGKATGHGRAARELVAGMRSKIRRIVASTPRPAGPPPTYYHELDPNLFSVTSRTFIGRVYGLFGLRNIADAARGAGSGYPQLSAEYVVKADPDLVFLADAECCDVTPEAVAARPGWDAISAVRRHAVIALDEDVASRWGPRIVQLARAVARALARVEDDAA